MENREIGCPIAAFLGVARKRELIQKMTMSRTSRRRTRHLHLVMSAEEFTMIQSYANRLGLAMADAIRLAVRAQFGIVAEKDLVNPTTLGMADS